MKVERHLTRGGIEGIEGSQKKGQLRHSDDFFEDSVSQGIHGYDLFGISGIGQKT